MGGGLGWLLAVGWWELMMMMLLGRHGLLDAAIIMMMMVIRMAANIQDWGDRAGG